MRSARNDAHTNEICSRRREKTGLRSAVLFFPHKNKHQKKMASTLLSLRRFSATTRTLSGCALAAISVLSVSVHPIHAWTGDTRFTPAMSTMTTNSDATHGPFTLAQFPCRSDNYGFLLHDASTGQTAAIDTPCGRSYEEELAKRGWKLTHILNTHHHHDHVGANLQLKTDGVQIIGPKNERKEIPGMDYAVQAGDTLKFGNVELSVMDAGGHTVGHVAYYFPDQSFAFVGDCLFALGCGRMFEGTQEQFWQSLEGLRQLPDDTVIYCAHEYTLANAKFALSVEPNNEDLLNRIAVVKSKRERDAPTIPFLLGEEKKSNPFLRADISEEIRANIGATSSDTPAQAFGKLRKAKDRF